MSDARSGDEEALDALCRHFQPRVSAYVSRHMGATARRWADPDDVVQVVLVELPGRLAALPDDAGEQDLLNSLKYVASSRIKDSVRHNHRRSGESASPDGAWDPSDSSASDGPVTSEEMRRVLYALVERLPDKYRDVVRLRVMAELSFTEIGKQLGLEPATVRKRYETARASLERRMSSRR